MRDTINPSTGSEQARGEGVTRRGGRVLKAIVRVWSERVFVGAALFGLALRGYQISGQILADDEWHALHALTSHGYAHIFSHFGGADYSIPLTLLFKTLATTVGLTEMVMRAPMLICGVAALVALPLLARQYVGRPAAQVFAWLLAIAPLHVYFSRYARPYGITMLLSVVAVVAFFKWLTGGPRPWASAYIVAAVAAAYFHLAVLPVVVSPIAFGLLDGALGRRKDGRTPREVLAVGAVVGAGLAAFLTIPLVVDSSVLAQKVARSVVEWATLEGAARLVAGTSRPWLGTAMAVFSVTGSVWLARRQPRLVAYILVLVAGQITALALTHPLAINVPIVLARYSLPFLPFLLLSAAVGIVHLEAAVARRLPAYPTGSVAALVVGLLFAFGPLPSLYRYPNNWTNHALFQYGYEPTSPYAAALRPYRLSPFYARLAAHPPGTLLIVEAPWYSPWSENPYPYYQAVHRQRMAVGFVAPRERLTRAGELPAASGVRFRNAVHLGDTARLQQLRVRYVILHRHLLEEFPAGERERSVVGIKRWIESYARVYGDPVYEDTDIVAFDVAEAARGWGTEAKTPD